MLAAELPASFWGSALTGGVRDGDGVTRDDEETIRAGQGQNL